MDGWKDADRETDGWLERCRSGDGWKNVDRQTGLVTETWQALFVSSLLTTAAILILPELMAGATAAAVFPKLF